MEQKTIKITEQEYQKLKEHEQIDCEVLTDIAQGIKDILQGRIKEI